MAGADTTRQDADVGGLVEKLTLVYVRRTALLLNFAKNDILLYDLVASIQHQKPRQAEEERRGCCLVLPECGVGFAEMSWRFRGGDVTDCWRSEMKC